jgi:hypothetical protein
LVLPPAAPADVGGVGDAMFNDVTSKNNRRGCTRTFYDGDDTIEDIVFISILLERYLPPITSARHWHQCLLFCSTAGTGTSTICHYCITRALVLVLAPPHSLLPSLEAAAAGSSCWCSSLPASSTGQPKAFLSPTVLSRPSHRMPRNISSHVVVEGERVGVVRACAALTPTSDHAWVCFFQRARALCWIEASY